MGKRENKKLSSRFVPTRCVIENSKKITKKLKKLKNTVVASFQAKIRCNKAVKERKLKLSFRSIPTRHVIENSKKIRKIKRYHYGFISSFLVGKVWERTKIKIIVPFRFYPMHNGKFQKNSKKMKNIKKNTTMASFQWKIGWKRPRKRENKNYRFVSFLPEA